uniref:Uncharacterized protein n=1 Tax=Triticum urartu TaxID=4572 RepID=A0A8R7UY87_TRIUA
MRIRRPPPRCWKSMLGAPGMCSCMLGRNFSFESIDEPMASDMPYVYSTTYDRVKTSLIDGDGFLSCWCNCMFSYFSSSTLCARLALDRAAALPKSRSNRDM